MHRVLELLVRRLFIQVYSYSSFSVSGVLTKPDRIETLDEAKRWIELVKNQRSKLLHGWFCVKQPNSDELKKKLRFEDARQLGEKFFKDTAPWSTLEASYKKRLGQGNLTRSLNKHLLDLISKR
jgi:hypothetical protein